MRAKRNISFYELLTERALCLERVGCVVEAVPVLQVVLDVPHQALELEQLRRADNLVPGLVAAKIFLHG